jgi:diadenosine tetraphosphate (Ap4A) HIT family hydrolase
MKTRLVNTKFARGLAYQKAMKEIVAAGVCPFCPENFKWHTKPILRGDGNWFITENFRPYANAKYHFVIINKAHYENLKDIKSSDLVSIFNLANWAVKKFKIKGGGVTLRFGDSDFTGATVTHLHFHLISPNIKNGVITPVYFPIG